LNRLGWLESDDDKTSQKDPVRIETKSIQSEQ
jgi:hypothetical protein